MGTVHHATVCTLFLIAEISALLQSTVATDSASVTSHGTKLTFRAEMNMVQPNSFMEKSSTDRIAHHVRTSRARTKYLADRMQGKSAQGSWETNVTAVPGCYAMSLALGTPPQTFTVVADTGSDFTWVQAKGCSSCFDGNKSSSYKPLRCDSAMCSLMSDQSDCTNPSSNCKYNYHFGDQYIANGTLSAETLTFATTNGTDQSLPLFAFGAGNDAEINPDGFMGLGRGPLSFSSQLGSQYGNVFSYCLVNFSGNEYPAQSSPMIFGSGAVPSGDVQYTPLLTVKNTIMPAFWFVNLTGISVDNKKLIIEKRQDPGTVIDSFSTLSALEPATYKALKLELVAKTKYPQVLSSGLGFLCFDTLSDSNPTFPGITFHFDGADWVLPRENTFTQVENNATWCLYMTESHQESHQGVQVIGNFQQQNFHVVYDGEKERVGWLPTRCDLL